MNDPDILVVGGGSNSLTAACYLAKAGFSVVVLEKNDQAGGGVVSVEIAPGFIQDTHAMGYMTCLANPAIRHDELGLQSKFGLEWAYTEAPFATIFDDGTGMISYRDLDKTCAEISKFSAKDAESYRKLVAEAEEILPVILQGFYAPPLPSKPFFSLLAQSDFGQKLTQTMQATTLDLLEDRFESVEVKIHFGKWCSEMMVGPDMPGTGLTLLLLLGLSHTFEMGTVVGGSWNLTNALIRCLEHHGGEIRKNSFVRRTLIEGGECVGVEMGNGEKLFAKRAVVANIHPWRLGDMVSSVAPDILEKAKTVKLSEFGALNQQIALEEKPRWKAGPQYEKATLVECVAKDWSTFLSSFQSFRRHEMPLDHLSPLINIQSNIDPSRAPAGKSSLYLYNFAPFDLTGGWPERKMEIAEAIWDHFASFTENMDRSKIIARLVECPEDHAAHSPNMMKGDIMGCAMTADQLLGARPIPELADYTIPGIKKLYLAGPFMHPGGTVTLGGRATAMKILDDMGTKLDIAFSNY